MGKRIKNEIQKRIDEILAHMTLREKIGQLNQEALRKNNINDLMEKIRRGEVGSILLADSTTPGNDYQQKLPIEVINKLINCAINESR